MEIIYIVLTVIYVFCCLFLGFVVLIQKGEGGGLGGAFGGGAVDQAFGAKADMTWKRATAVAAALFMILAITLGIMQSKLQQSSIAARAAAEAEANKAQQAQPEGEKAADGEQPADGAAPADGEKPADGEQPADGDKPADGEQPAGE